MPVRAHILFSHFGIDAAGQLPGVHERRAFLITGGERMTDLFEYAMRDEQRRSGGDTKLIRDFFKFHSENPQVYELFSRFTRQVIDRGFEHYSADAVMHRVR